MSCPPVRAWTTIAALCTLAPAFTPALSAQHTPVATVATPQSVAAEWHPSNGEATSAKVFTRTVSVRLDRVSLEQAIKAVAASANVHVQYQVPTLQAVTRPVSLTADSVLLGTAFAQLLAPHGLRAVSSGSDLVTITAASREATAMNGAIVGVVTDAKTKRPIVGATIFLDDATKGVVTDENGAFRITASVGQHSITARAVGRTKVTLSITVKDNESTTVEVNMSESANVLGEVIVTGTVAATERKALPAPITVITAEELEKRNITRVEQLFRGEVPGVIAVENGTQAYNSLSLGEMARSRVYSRGSTSLDGSANPLKTYVDGVELLDASYLGTIDPKNIERIEIITGPQAATIYGSGALGGVMQIFTKKGSGRTTPELTLALKYGVLQSNFSNGNTPSHDQLLQVTGGAGPTFSYSGNVAHRYSGQWQPNLFSRTFSASAGAAITQGRASVSGSVGLTSSENGQVGLGEAPCGPYGAFFGCYSTLVGATSVMEGERTLSNPAAFFTRQTSTSSNQNLTLNADYRATSIWQHHLTLGRVTTGFEQPPVAPQYARPYDSLYTTKLSQGNRVTASYNTSVLQRFGAVAPSLTLGFDGSWAKNRQFSGSAGATNTTDLSGATFTQLLDDEHWGGFGNLQVGFFDNLYLTLALRGEHNPNYGRNYKVDWTPTQGLTYTVERGDITMKFLVSYGSATRPPQPSQRNPYLGTCSTCNPSAWVELAAAPELGPEYSRGTQGGFELYYGNLGSITLNHYVQKVDHLIQQIVVSDSFYIDNVAYGYGYWTATSQYANVAAMKQFGWSSTASLNFGPLSLKGTYSCDDSRVTAVELAALRFGQHQVGEGFIGVPTHTGNLIATYARGGTTATISMDYVGSQLNTLDFIPVLYVAIRNPRLAMYYPRRKDLSSYYTSYPGYVKSNLNISHRLTPWATATVDVKNLGNSYASDVTKMFPSLGRQTLFGVSMRFPKTR